MEVWKDDRVHILGCTISLKTRLRKKSESFPDPRSIAVLLKKDCVISCWKPYIHMHSWLMLSFAKQFHDSCCSWENYIYGGFILWNIHMLLLSTDAQLQGFIRQPIC